jgi:valyl-tRNA synthetase
MKEMPKAYEPAKYEDDIYKKWEISGFFNPDNLDLPSDAKPYTIVLPPPNITDKLHMGHASMLAIEDLLIRFHRMNGRRALWIPGTDHAAIATQNVVEKKLLKEEGLTRHDLGRDKFLQRVWQFLRETQSTILYQTRKMGASLDWSREAFTLDEKREYAVKEMFVAMYNAGAIYRGERIVNWCPRCHSTLADDEVEYKEQKARLYTFRYSKEFPFSIATTRPETKLGDTAVAVNPKDERYRDVIGQEFTIEFCGIPLKLKIIGDHNVDMEFGTGTLGVTPAHSMIDWQMSLSNNLAVIKVIDEDGRIRSGFGEFSGLTAVEARERIVGRLISDGLMEKDEEIDNNISICYRCGTPIEPLPSRQWFVAVDKKLDSLAGISLKEKAIKAAEKGDIKFIPERFSKRFLDWMKDLHDWCISRQIWFGHRIPVYYCRSCGEIMVSMTEVGKCTKCASDKVEQDPDSLDTWFSSGMWTFSTLGWPHTFRDGKKSGDLARFHPTQVLETGYDILTLWVSRMIMMSFFALGEIPFEYVYLHGTILDEKGKKMSKSKGNGIDPLDMINKFGTDATRLSLLVGNTPGNDMKLSEEKIEGQKNLVNKIWNISRYILSRYEVKKDCPDADAGQFTIADRWILEKFKSLIKSVTDNLDNYRFSQAGEDLKRFTWDDLADWYLEVCKFEKSVKKDRILNYIIVNLLKLWHPFTPFVTEAIWSNFSDTFLMVEKWPTENLFTKRQTVDLDDFENIIIPLICVIRNARAENNVDASKKLKAVIFAGAKTQIIKSQEHLIRNLKTGIEDLVISEKGDKIDNAVYATMAGIDIYLIGSLDAEKEKVRIKKELNNLEEIIKRIESLLSSGEFKERAPFAIVEKEKERLIVAKAEFEKLLIQLKEYK